MPWQVVYSGGADGGPDSGAVAVVTMCTSRANQINTAFLDDLDRAVGEVCGHTPPVRGMVLTSTGSVFSSGLDIVHNFNDRAFTRAFIQRYESAMRRVLTLPFPTVAALNGHTVAGGCVLALACDFRVAASGKYNIGVDEVRNNVPFPKVTMEIVRVALSNKAQRDALLLGKFWSPQDALQAGVVDALAQTPVEAVTRAEVIVRSLPPDARAAYATNKAYLQAPFLAAMKGETYDGFVDACYTAEAQARFDHARRSMRARQAAKRKSNPGDSGAGGGGADSGAGGGAGAGAPELTEGHLPGGRMDVYDRVVLLERDGVLYEVMRPCHLQATTACLVDVWVGNNVIMDALAVTKEDFQPLAAKRCKDGVHAGLSLVATDTTTGECVGFFLWEDMAASAWAEKLDISPKFGAQFEFMMQLEAEYTKYRGHALRRGEVLHGIYGGTKATHAGRHVVTHLMELSEVWAVRCGFTRMVTEAVVIGSQHVSFKLGWKDIALKQYTTFTFQGSTPFAGVPVKAHTPCAVLFELRLDLLERHKHAFQRQSTAAQASATVAQAHLAAPLYRSRL